MYGENGERTRFPGASSIFGERMVRVLSRSTRRRALALLIGVIGFVLLYEATTIDSQNLAWQAVFGDPRVPSPGARLQFSATAYCKGQITASGVRPRTGVAAADPSLLPVGSVLNVSTGDAKYTGVYTVMDTGPEVKGRELDLYIWSCNEALVFGRRPVQVTVLRLGWDPKASSPSLIDRLFRRRESTRRSQPPPPPRTNSPTDAQSAPAQSAPENQPAPSGTTSTGGSYDANAASQAP